MTDHPFIAQSLPLADPVQSVALKGFLTAPLSVNGQQGLADLQSVAARSATLNAAGWALALQRWISARRRGAGAERVTP